MKVKILCDVCQDEIIYYTERNLKELQKRVFKRCKTCISKSGRTGSCEPLMNLSNEAFYWIGFILADGHIENNKRLRVTLSVKDIKHLEKLAVFLGTNVKLWKNEKYCYISIQDKYAIEELCRKYDIKSNKTVYPPYLDMFKNLAEVQLLSLFAGFIDGDGCIRNLHNRKDFNLQIKVHSEWLDIINFFSLKFLGKERAYLNAMGYTYLACGDSVILKELKHKIIQLDLPLLKRKWDIIDFNFKGKVETGAEVRKNIISLHNSGLTNREISIKLGFSDGHISTTLKKYKNENTNK